MPVQDLQWCSIGLEQKPNSCCVLQVPPWCGPAFRSHLLPLSSYSSSATTGLPIVCLNNRACWHLLNVALVDVPAWNTLPQSLHSWLLVTTWISSHIISSTVSSLPWCSHVMWPKATHSVLHHFIFYLRLLTSIWKGFFFFFSIYCRHISSLCCFLEVQFQEKGPTTQQPCLQRIQQDWCLLTVV